LSPSPHLQSLATLDPGPRIIQTFKADLIPPAPLISDRASLDPDDLPCLDIYRHHVNATEHVAPFSWEAFA